MEQQSDAEQRLAELAANEDAVVAIKESAAAQLAVAKGAGADEEAALTEQYDAGACRADGR